MFSDAESDQTQLETQKQNFTNNNIAYVFHYL